MLVFEPDQLTGPFVQVLALEVSQVLLVERIRLIRPAPSSTARRRRRSSRGCSSRLHDGISLRLASRTARRGGCHRRGGFLLPRAARGGSYGRQLGGSFARTTGSRSRGSTGNAGITTQVAAHPTNGPRPIRVRLEVYIQVGAIVLDHDAPLSKPSLPEVPLVLLDQARPRDAADVQCHVRPELLRQGLLGQDVGDGDAAAGLQQAVHLLEDEGLVLLRHEVDDAVGDDAVGCVRGDGGHVGYLGINEADVGLVVLCLDLVGSGEHVLVTEVSSAISSCEGLVPGDLPCSCRRR